MYAKVFKKSRHIGIAAALAVSVSAAPALAQNVENIRVEGTQRIEDATILSYMTLKEGDPIDPVRVNESLKGLFATGLFSDVQIRRDGDDIVVKVDENPVINRIAFEGNKRIANEDLEAEVGIRSRSIYTRTRVLADVERIEEIYRRSGRYAATVEPKVIQRDHNRVDVVFEIDEGPLTYVSRITFNGNRHFSDGDLRERLLTKEEAWYRFLSSTDRFDPQRLAFDKEQLRRFYLSKGFADFEIKSAVAELSPDRRNFFITFTVDEGERYAINNIDVEATLPELDDPSSLKKHVTFEKGDWYNADEVENTIQDLTDGVGELGYAFVDINPDVVRNRDDKTIDLTFRINEGPRVFVKRIEIQGNMRTKDEVIRREFRLVEGDPFNSAKVRRTRQRLQNLGFFKSVDLKTEQSPTNPEEMTLKVEVQEQATGEIMIGAGYSSDDGAKMTFGLGERNFLGKGQRLKFNVGLAESGSEIDISFTEPYFLDRELAAGVDLFHVTKDLSDESSYDYETSGMALRAGFSYSENLRHSFKYTIREDNIENIESDASTFIKQQEGRAIVSMIGHNLTYDRRDSMTDPTEGYYVRLGNDLAGLGGDAKFFRTNISGGQYFNLADGYVLGLSGFAGYMFGLGDDVTISHRYFNGGERKVRGFAASGISPRDKATDDALGGNWSTYESVELKFPLGLPQELGISASTFVDMGSVGEFDNMDSAEVNHETSLRMSLGLAFIWRSPMGPMNMSFAMPLLKEDYDDTESLQFNFGARF